MSVPYLDATGGTARYWFLAQTFASLAQQAARMSQRNAPMLILGERGSRPEREALARVVHDNSPRARSPFVKLAWEELSESYLETQLFGSNRVHPGDAKFGLIDRAAGGTLYIEETSRFSFATQSKLLALLQTGKFRPAGTPYEKLADVRIVFGSGHAQADRMPEDDMHPELMSEVASSALIIPPLRQRKNEIVQLADQCILECADAIERPPPRLSPEAVETMLQYTWPHNIEELARAIRHAVDATPSETIEAGHLPTEIAGERTPGVMIDAGLQETLAHVERVMIVRALESARGNQTRAAKALGISERLIGLRVRKYNLDPKRYRTKL